jgi:hypothetical protein
LKADLQKHYPGIQIVDEFRSPDDQMAIRRRVAAQHGMSLDDPNLNIWVAGPNGSHTWGTAMDIKVSHRMWEQFKRDIRARGLRAYDEHGHIHVDDRTDLPNGPGN